MFNSMKKLTVVTQLTIGFGLLLAFLIGIIAFSTYQQNRLAELTEKQYKPPFTVSNAVARADANLSRMVRGVRDVALAENETKVQEYSTEIDGLEQKVMEDLNLAKERYLGDKADFDKLI